MHKCLGAILLASMATFSATAEGAPDFDAANRSLTENVALPLVREFASATQVAADIMRSYCAGDGGDPTAAFAVVTNAWQQVRPLALGPLLEGDGISRFQYWPDKHGTGARQLRRTLKAEDLTLLEVGALENQSVALSDLQALEYLLFDADMPGPGGYACSLAKAITAHQADIARDLDIAWQDFASVIASADQGNDAFYDAADATQSFMGAIQETLEFLHATKLDRPLGQSLETARPKRSESWRSSSSLDNIQANLMTIQALFTAEDGPRAILSDAGYEPLANGMVSSMSKAIADIDAIDLSLAEAVTDPVLRQDVTDLRKRLKSLDQLTRGTVASALGLNLGFNASDGD